MSEKLLKLKAKDSEDIQVISAVLQDAIAPVVDMTFNAAEKNFIMVVHRLKREAAAENLERICCAINVRGVESVQMQGFSPLSQQTLMLDLLAIMLEGDALLFIFAANAAIRLHLKDWNAIVGDFGEPWPAQCNPCHDSERQAG